MFASHPYIQKAMPSSEWDGDIRTVINNIIQSMYDALDDYCEKDGAPSDAPDERMLDHLQMVMDALPLEHMNADECPIIEFEEDDGAIYLAWNMQNAGINIFQSDDPINKHNIVACGYIDRRGFGRECESCYIPANDSKKIKKWFDDFVKCTIRPELIQENKNMISLLEYQVIFPELCLGRCSEETQDFIGTKFKDMIYQAADDETIQWKILYAAATAYDPGFPVESGFIELWNGDDCVMRIDSMAMISILSDNIIKYINHNIALYERNKPYDNHIKLKSIT